MAKSQSNFLRKGRFALVIDGKVIGTNRITFLKGTEDIEILRGVQSPPTLLLADLCRSASGPAWEPRPFEIHVFGENKDAGIVISVTSEQMFQSFDSLDAEDMGVWKERMLFLRCSLKMGIGTLDLDDGVRL